MEDVVATHSLLARLGTPDQRLSFILDTMREMSELTDPQVMVRTYSARMRQLIPSDRSLSLSRRDLRTPYFRVTRSSTWDGEVNPWRQGDRLPVLEGGLLAGCIYGDEPVVIDDLEFSPDDPAAQYFEGMRSLVAIPLFDAGRAINMVVVMRKEPLGYRRDMLAEHVWMANLFGRATKTLVLAQEVKRAYDVVDRELKAVADIQRSLLPAALPKIPGLDIAVHYQTSRHSGGDYYDFFQLPDGQWGILVADVSGHGTPAAVLMAITHSIAHIACDPPVPPARLLAAINERLCRQYTKSSGNFVTAFYGVYDPKDRTLLWSNAGHPPPRLARHGGTAIALPPAASLPLGIEPDEPYGQFVHQLAPGDALLLYTDGITEAREPAGEMFGVERIDTVLACTPRSSERLIRATLIALESFTDGRAPADDQTLLVMQVRE
jgi:sigma-B regulation protein RsbU (phosphoserine phosphatase)